MTRMRCTYSVSGNTRPGGVREDFLGPGNTSPDKTQVRVTHKCRVTVSRVMSGNTRLGKIGSGNTGPGDICPPGRLG